MSKLAARSPKAKFMWLAPSRMGAGGAFSAPAVTFNGTSTFLTRGAAMTGAANNSKGTFSAWVRWNGGDGVLQRIMRDSTGFTTFRKLASNTVDMVVSDPAGALTLNITGSTAITSGTTWRHHLWSWDTNFSAGNKLAHYYLSGVNNKLAANDGGAAAFVCKYTDTNWGLGATVAGADFLNADLGPLWFDFGTFFDFTVTANLRKFIDANGDPVDMGPNGEAVTGKKPTMFFSGNKGGWATNLGTGGGMTTNGAALTDATTSPSS